MKWELRPYLVAALLVASFVAKPAFAQTAGGILQMQGFASPASMSIHEESTIAAGIPLMGVFNNLVLFDQHVAQNSLSSIVPDLASDWSWTRPERRSHSICIRVSNGMTASRSPLPTSNALGT